MTIWPYIYFAFSMICVGMATYSYMGNKKAEPGVFGPLLCISFLAWPIILPIFVAEIVYNYKHPEEK